MPKQLKEIKDFVTMVRSRKDIKQIRIKKTKKITKFKVRTGGNLYTLVVNDPEKVQKLRQTVPENLIVDVPAKH
jgi:large subunit ribosomal protein L38e